jgi:hypothetical protein
MVVTPAPLEVPPTATMPAGTKLPEPPDPTRPEVPAAPHIALGEGPDGTAGAAEWVKWAFLFALFVASAAVAFWLISLP